MNKEQTLLEFIQETTISQCMRLGEEAIGRPLSQAEAIFLRMGVEAGTQVMQKVIDDFEKEIKENDAKRPLAGILKTP